MSKLKNKNKISKPKKKKNIIISIDAENILDKIQHPQHT